MQSKVVLHEVCARRSGQPETITALLRDANNIGKVPPELHEIAADALETIQRCCAVNKPPRDFIEIGSAMMVKMAVCLMEKGIQQKMRLMQESEGRQV